MQKLGQVLGLNERPQMRMLNCKERIIPPHLWQPNNTLFTGTYSATGDVDVSSLLCRNYGDGPLVRLGLPFVDCPEPEDELEEALYAGPLFPGFGHFVLESVARLWTAREVPEVPIVWTGASNGPGQNLAAWHKELLGLLGLRNEVLILKKPTLVRRLLLPDPGYQIQGFFHPKHDDFLSTFAYSGVPGRRVWISRSRIEKSSNPGLRDLETKLGAMGWDVVCPETLPIREQLRRYSSAERIAAEQGSALHALVFLKRARNLRVDVIARDPELSLARMNQNYRTIAERKGFRQHIHIIPEERVLSRNGPRVEKACSSAAPYLRALGLKD